MFLVMLVLMELLVRICLGWIVFMCRLSDMLLIK